MIYKVKNNYNYLPVWNNKSDLSIHRPFQSCQAYQNLPAIKIKNIYKNRVEIFLYLNDSIQIDKFKYIFVYSPDDQRTYWVWEELLEKV